VDGRPPQICMIGGKWTTFRAFAEQVTDTALALLGEVRRRGTLDLAIGGGAGLELIADPGTRIRPTDRPSHLRALYGSGADSVAAFCSAAGADRLLEGTLYSRAEIIRMIRHERVCTLADIVLRRTDMAIRGTISLRLIAELAEIFARETELSAPAAGAEADALIDELDRWHGVSREMLASRDIREEAVCA
jgi:glycerol-3-phosphate dehydrogenase